MKTIGTYACLWPGLPAAPVCLRLATLSKSQDLAQLLLKAKNGIFSDTYPRKVLGGRAFLAWCGMISFFPFCSQMLLIYCRLSSALSYFPVISSSDALVSQKEGEGHGPSSFPIHLIPLAHCPPGLSRSDCRASVLLHLTLSLGKSKPLSSKKVNEEYYGKLFLHLKLSWTIGGIWLILCSAARNLLKHLIKRFNSFN